jgi:chitin synthase
MCIALLMVSHRTWAIWDKSIYDLTDYFYTISVNQGNTGPYTFLNSAITDIFQQQPGQDITKPLNAALAQLDATTVQQNIQCLNNVFYVGEKDYRKEARCQVQNYLLLVASSILVASVAMKCECSHPFLVTDLFRVEYSPRRASTKREARS